MISDSNYLTAEKEELLKKELNDLKTVKRKQILETLEYARSLGDLSENAEYHNARDEQGRLEDRITKIENILRTATIVSSSGHGNIVEVGSVVVLKKEKTNEEIEYTIVGAEESDMSQGKLSHASPLGIALFGKKKGDQISLKTPKGNASYLVVSVK